MALILMADDDEIVGEIAREALTAAGHRVGLLADGLDVMHVMRTKRPEVVILDCNMPRKGGLLVLREMRVTSEFCETPVMILTARRSERDVELAMFAGANDYLKKPFDPDELVFRIENLLARRPPAAGHRRVRPAARTGLSRVVRIFH